MRRRRDSLVRPTRATQVAAAVRTLAREAGYKGETFKLVAKNSAENAAIAFALAKQNAALGAARARAPTIPT